MFTHFHSAERSDATRELQEKRFADAIAALPARLGSLVTESTITSITLGRGHRNDDPQRARPQLYKLIECDQPFARPQSRHLVADFGVH